MTGERSCSKGCKSAHGNFHTPCNGSRITEKSNTGRQGLTTLFQKSETHWAQNSLRPSSVCLLDCLALLLVKAGGSSLRSSQLKKQKDVSIRMNQTGPEVEESHNRRNRSCSGPDITSGSRRTCAAWWTERTDY